MLTSLDFLILIVMALVAVSLVAMVLMFLIKNDKFRRVCLYLVAALGIYVSCVGLRLLWPNFMGQVFVAALTLLTSLAAIVLERLSKNNNKRFLAARLMASAALLASLINAFAV